MSESGEPHDRGQDINLDSAIPDVRREDLARDSRGLVSDTEALSEFGSQFIDEVDTFDIASTDDHGSLDLNVEQTSENAHTAVPRENRRNSEDSNISDLQLDEDQDDGEKN